MDSNAGSRHEVTIAADQAGERLDRALAAALAQLDAAPSRSRIKALIEAGHVAIGGRTISEPSHRVKPGDQASIAIPDPTPADPQPQARALEIVYEDDHLIVIDKPPGLVVHPAPGNPDNTLVNALLAHCGASLAGIGGVRRPGIVHRLDKDTSGLMVAAKTDTGYQGLARQFAAHSVDRAYQALVWGVPAPAAGDIAGAIGRHPVDRKRMAVVVAGRGRPALTRYRVLKVLAGGAVSLIECRLATGRTHQIRVHLAHLGHGLLGDPVYASRSVPRRTAGTRLPPEAIAALAAFSRQALDAVELGFAHPASGKKLSFTKMLSLDIKELMYSLDPL